MVKYIRHILGLGVVILMMCIFATQGVQVEREFYSDSGYRVGTLAVQELYELPHRVSASSDGAVQTKIYDNEDVFVSNWISADVPFHALGISWKEEVLDDTHAQLYVRTRKLNGRNSEWVEVVRDIDDKDESHHEHEHEHEHDAEHEIGERNGTYYSFLRTAWSTHIQYKVELLSNDTDITPRVSEVEFTYIDAQRSEAELQKKDDGESDFEVAEVDGLQAGEFSDTSDDLIASLKITGPQKQLKIISRQQWGANERLRVFDKLGKPTQIEVDEEIQEKYADEIELRREVKKNKKGELLTWPLQYPMQDIKAVFVHHTASQEDALEDSYAAMRAIYYYHAVSRGWGDIGYNYLIDEDGNVFEGRSGGDKVVGAHTANFNVGSVGVAIIGNYQEDEVKSGSVSGLIELLTYLMEKYTLDPTEIVKMRGQNVHVVSGHRDATSTVCPGEHLYDKLSSIRQLIKSELIHRGTYTGTEEIVQSANGIDFEDINDREIIVIGPEEQKTISIKLRNTGSKTWGRSTSLVYKNGNHNIAGFDETVARIKEQRVKPGQMGTFDIPIQGSFASGLKNYYLQLKVGTVLSKRKILFPVYIEPAEVTFELGSMEKTPKLKLDKNESTRVTFTLTNTGNVTWYPGQILLASTTKDSLFVTGNMLTRSPVAPGRNAQFEIVFKAGMTAGRFEEKIRLILRDAGGNQIQSRTSQDFNFRVKGLPQLRTGEKLIFMGSSDTTLKGKEKKRMWIEIQNNSNAIWTRTGTTRVHIATLNAPSMNVKNVVMQKATVKPGETTKVYFDLTAPEKNGDYFINFIFRHGTYRLLKQPMRFEYKVNSSDAGARTQARMETVPYTGPLPVANDTSVQPKKYANEGITNKSKVISTAEENLGENIRVALSFRGHPLISADSNIRIYDRTGNHLNSGIPITGKRISISYENDRYIVRFGNKRITTDKYIRIGSDNGILKINNFENRPAWNPDLNDNEFRGVLEIQWLEDAQHPEGGEFRVINELPLEQYLYGIGEVSNGDPTEKIKTIAVLARTYAKYYIDRRGQADAKFPRKPYDLDDDPDVSQKYLGYGLEKRSPKIKRAVDATRGQVVEYEGEVVKTPYFNSTDGTATRSAEDVWGWTHTPYLVSVSDPLCEATAFNGHGVGLSGCGATQAAQRGYSFKDIIKYYYTGVEIADLY